MSTSTKFKLRVSYEHTSMGHFLQAHEHRSFLTSTVSTKKPYEHEHKTLFRPYEHEHDTLFRAQFSICSCRQNQTESAAADIIWTP